jgi:N-hydroxyarylamine O-acetyltransferase
VDPDRYLTRIGLDPAAVAEPTMESLRTLQRAHVGTVPFENLAIVGDPFADADGAGVTLALPALYEKIVERERGGFCFELNGLFGWLLDEFGFESERIAARVVSDDGTARPPANHHTHTVTLDRRYVVDVGLGGQPLRLPLPLDGTPRTDETGVTWQVAESDRPDADYLTQFRQPGTDDWEDKYIFRDEPRDLQYFAATCEYLATAPESAFTDGPTVTIATPEGYRKLSRDTLTAVNGSEETEQTVDESEWHDVLEKKFGLRLDTVERK